MERRTSKTSSFERNVVLSILLLFFAFLLLRPRGIIFAATPVPSVLPVDDVPDPQNSTWAINFTCDGCGPGNVGEEIKLFICKDSSCINCTLNNTYPTSNPTFGNSSANSIEVSPENTLDHDGNLGFILTLDNSDTTAEEANWTWDFGYVRTGNFSVKWMGRLEPYDPGVYYEYYVELNSSVSSDGVNWETIRSVWLTYPSVNYTPFYNDTIYGSYRYIRVNLYSNASSMANVSLLVDYARVSEDLTENCWCNSSAVPADPWCTFTNTTSCNYATFNYWGRVCAFQHPWPWACNTTSQKTFTYTKENGCSCAQSVECFSGCCQGNGLCGDDCLPPQYSLNGSNTTAPGVGEVVLLHANWTDDSGLGLAWLSTNETGEWKNYTDGTYGSPVDINLTADQTWSNFTWRNSSVLAGTVVAWKIYANDSVNNVNVTPEMTFTVQPSWLEVELVLPFPDLTVDKDSAFTVNATIFCRRGECGSVNGTIRYNRTSPVPDTPINTTVGATPFYISETPAYAMKECPTNPLQKDEFCNLTWSVMASGDFVTYWKIGVLFNSTRIDVMDNHTDNATIKIVECHEDVSVGWILIDFGDLNPNTPGSDNPAPGNANKEYNITNLGTCNETLWIKGTDIENVTLPYPNVIGVGNLTWSNTTNDYTTSFQMSIGYRLLNSSLPPDGVLTTYYWLAVPPVYAGRYNGTLTIKWNTTQQTG